MAWIDLTSTALKELMAGAEFTSVTTAARGAGQDADTLVENALVREVKEARGYIGKRYTLGPAGTIPDEVEDACLARARIKVLTRLPGLKNLLTKERTDAAKEGLALLKSISKGDFVIVESDDPADDQPAAPIMRVIQKTAPVYSKPGLRRLF